MLSVDDWLDDSNLVGSITCLSGKNQVVCHDYGPSFVLKQQKKPDFLHVNSQGHFLPNLCNPLKTNLIITSTLQQRNFVSISIAWNFQYLNLNL